MGETEQGGKVRERETERKRDRDSQEILSDQIKLEQGNGEDGD